MRPYRSLLFVPAHKEGWAAKAANSGADALILDLEDAVPPDQKTQAREMLPAAIAEARSIRPNIGIVVRTNHWSTEFAPEDYEAVAATDADAVMVPKVQSRDEVVRLDAVLEHVERRCERNRVIELIATLETAAGVAHCGEIVTGPRSRGCYRPLRETRTSLGRSGSRGRREASRPCTCEAR